MMNWYYQLFTNKQVPVWPVGYSFASLPRTDRDNGVSMLAEPGGNQAVATEVVVCFRRRSRGLPPSPHQNLGRTLRRVGAHAFLLRIRIPLPLRHRLLSQIVLLPYGRRSVLLRLRPPTTSYVDFVWAAATATAS